MHNFTFNNVIGNLCMGSIINLNFELIYHIVPFSRGFFDVETQGYHMNILFSPPFFNEKTTLQINVSINFNIATCYLFILLFK